MVTYSIVGGRDGGFRGYSSALIDNDGEWRVNIETIDGRLLTRLPFIVEYVTQSRPQEAILLK